MFPENEEELFQEFEVEVHQDFADLTEEELELQLLSYKMMQDVTLQGKTVYKFNQEWLM
jgi:hypothetical protein